jgi:hypothetical protein
LGLEGCIVDHSQDIGWQRIFGHRRKIVPEMLSEEAPILTPSLRSGVMNHPAQRHGDRIETMAFARPVNFRQSIEIGVVPIALAI